MDASASSQSLSLFDFLDCMRNPASINLVRSIKSDGKRVQEFYLTMEIAIREHPLWTGATEEEIDCAMEGGLVEVREDYVEENPSKQDLKSEDKRVKVLEEKVKEQEAKVKEQEEKVKEQGEMLAEMRALIQSLLKEKGTGTPGSDNDGDNDDHNAAV